LVAAVVTVALYNVNVANAQSANMTKTTNMTAGGGNMSKSTAANMTTPAGQQTGVRPGYQMPNYINIPVAQRQCISAWINESWTQIANCFLFAFIPAVIYFIMAYTYYRQTTDKQQMPNRHTTTLSLLNNQ
jgi:hypothetical protein